MTSPDLPDAAAESSVATTGGRVARYWSHAWRLLLAAVVGGMAWAVIADEGIARGYTTDHLWMLVDLLLGLIAVGATSLRRRYPMTVLVLTSVLGGVAASASGAQLLATASVATSRRLGRIAFAGALGPISGALFSLVHDQRYSWTEVAWSVVVSGLAVAVGMYSGARRELVANLREQVRTAQREQQLRVDQARTAERAAIAREMHDVLAHRISLVAMHAGALAYRTDLPPEQVRSSATLVQDSAHQALIELREVLGILRDTDGDQKVEPPQPSLHDLDTIIGAARDAGTTVTEERTVDFGQVPDQLSRHAFRIIQEGLTNARKHASDQPVNIQLSGTAGETLAVRVSNPMPVDRSGPATPGSRLGLVGLGERAELAGGSLTAGPDRSGQFVMTARLPWPAPATEEKKVLDR
ncbi:sensor histidine kinase [Dermacoccaceae bacterium W4C1]